MTWLITSSVRIFVAACVGFTFGSLLPYEWLPYDLDILVFVLVYFAGSTWFERWKYQRWLDERDESEH